MKANVEEQEKRPAREAPGGKKETDSEFNLLLLFLIFISEFRM